MLIAPVNDPSELFTWEATIFSPEDSPFASVVFNLMMYFTHEYPLKPPKVHFQQEVFYPNVHKREYLLIFYGINELQLSPYRM